MNGTTDLVSPAQRVRRIIEEAIAEGELDGFFAAYLLEVFGNERRRLDLETPLVTLSEGFVFTRQNVARLGIALGRGWLPSSTQTVASYVEGFDRMLRQEADVATDFRAAPKILCGVAIGAVNSSVQQQRPDLGQEAIRAVERLPQRSGLLRDRILSVFVLAALDPKRRDERARDLARGLLARDVASLTPCDAVAALWSIQHQCGGGPTALTPERLELNALRDRLTPLAVRCEPNEVIDAVLTDGVLGDLLQAAVSGASVKGLGLETVLRTFESFPDLARRLRTRKQNRPPLLIETEYDVQDLLYVSLKPHLVDLTDEEWTSKHAGGAKRIDLVSVAARICIEAKMVRDANHARDIANELKQDIESYWVHPACDTLAVFVYDPSGHLMAPAHFETDLSGPRVIKGRPVEVIVRVRPR